MSRNNRDLQEIDAGSMADIAFLLLIFFLVTTTMDADTGLIRKLPPIIEDRTNPEVPQRNVFVVLANAQDLLLVEGAYMQPEDLRAAAKEFIVGYPDNPDDLRFPEFKSIDKMTEKDRKLVKKYLPNVKRYSKGMVSIQNDNGTSYSMYLHIQNELAAAYREVRDDASKANFGKTYAELKATDPLAAQAIKKVYAQRISEAEPNI